MIDKKQSHNPAKISSLQEGLFLAPNFEYLSEGVSKKASEEVTNFLEKISNIPVSDTVLFSFPSYIYEKSNDEELSTPTKRNSLRKKMGDPIKRSIYSDDVNSGEGGKSLLKRGERNTSGTSRKRSNKRRSEESSSIPKNKRIREWQFSELQYEFHYRDPQEEKSADKEFYDKTLNKKGRHAELQQDKRYERNKSKERQSELDHNTSQSFRKEYQDDVRYDKFLSAKLSGTSTAVGDKDEELSITERRKGINKARAAVIDRAQEKEEVGSFVEMCPLGNWVYNFYFQSRLVGYEGWQWIATLFYDKGCQKWTIDEVSLIPTKKSLLAPHWVSSKDHFE